MHEVAVVGAGELGGLCAHQIARRGAARVVRLIDERGRVAEGKALDIAEAAPVECFATEIVGSSDLAAAAGVDAIVLADPATSAAWPDGTLPPLIQRLMRAAPLAVVLCAHAASSDLVEQSVRELRLDRRRLVGTSPEALAAAVRALVALEVGGSPSDVSLALVGTPPAPVVIPWEDATAHGISLVRVLDDPTRRRLAAKLPALWPPGPYALASAAALAVDAIAGRTRRTLSMFLAPDDSLGVKARAVAIPARLGPEGAMPIALHLNARDQVAFDNACLR